MSTKKMMQFLKLLSKRLKRRKSKIAHYSIPITTEEVSGNFLPVKDIQIDCDKDTFLLKLYLQGLIVTLDQTLALRTKH